MALDGSSLCCKVGPLDEGKILQLSCSCIDGFKKLNRFFPPNLKQNHMFLATASSVRHYGHPKFCSKRTFPFVQNSRLLSSRACQVKSEDSEDILSDESIILDEQTLMQDLQNAIKEENYARAAKIRDSLRELQEDSKASVLAANARFYNAFRQGNLAAMQALWTKGDHVCCVHPGASGVLGYDDVVESWDVVWMNYDFPLDIELKNIRVHFRGDVGYVTCIEFIRTKGSSWGAQFVTNVFERIDDHWFICIHHASPLDL